MFFFCPPVFGVHHNFETEIRKSRQTVLFLGLISDFIEAGLMNKLLASHESGTSSSTMLIPKKNRIAVYSHLFKGEFLSLV